MTIDSTVAAVREHITTQRDRIFQDLSEICSFHSVHTNPEYAQPHAGAAAWVDNALKEAGLDVTAYCTDTPSPIFVGTKPATNGAPTVLLYSHYDVVPAGDPADWLSDPCTLTERDGRWYARGAADCKGNLVMHLAALRAVTDLGGTDLGLIVLVEGSEEMGGDEFDALLEAHPEAVAADVILIADSGNTEVGVPTLTTSLRGTAQIRVTVSSLAAPVHSGQFGGAAPDAAAALIRMIDSLRDDKGRTRIDGLDCTQKWQGAQYDRAAFRKDAGLLEGVEILGDADDTIADMVWARPSVSVIGWTSTPVDKAVNAVPATATAQLSVRVPPGLTAEEVNEKVVAHLRAHAPYGVHVDTQSTELHPPFATDITGPALTVFGQCLAAAYGGQELTVVGSGGSIPLCSALQSMLPGAELALFGVEEPLSVIHSPNESVDPNEIRDIAIAEAAFLLTYAQHPRG